MRGMKSMVRRMRKNSEKRTSDGYVHIGKVAIIKGIVHLNIIFSYMKVNKICNLDHPVYKIYLC